MNPNVIYVCVAFSRFESRRYRLSSCSAPRPARRSPPCLRWWSPPLPRRRQTQILSKQLNLLVPRRLKGPLKQQTSCLVQRHLSLKVPMKVADGKNGVRFRSTGLSWHSFSLILLFQKCHVHADVVGCNVICKHCSKMTVTSLTNILNLRL